MKHFSSLSILFSILLYSSTAITMQLVFKDAESQKIYREAKRFMSEVQSEYQLCLHTNKHGLTQKLESEKINKLIKQTKEKISLIQDKLEQANSKDVVLIELHRALNRYEIALDDLCEINHELYEKTLEHGKKKTYNELIPKSKKLSERVIEWQTMTIRNYKYSNTKLKRYKKRKIDIAKKLYFEQGAVAIEKMIFQIQTIFDEVFDAINQDMNQCLWKDYKSILRRIRKKYKNAQKFLIENLSIYITENHSEIDSNNEIKKYFEKYTPNSPYIRNRIAGWKILSKKLTYCIDNQIIEADVLWLNGRKEPARLKISSLREQLEQTQNNLITEYNSVQKYEFKRILEEAIYRLENAIEYVQDFSFT